MEVPGIYDVRISFKLVPAPEGKPRYVLLMPMSLQGGVDFRTKRNWSVPGPKPPTYAAVEDQLTTSAALGESAVRSALGGDLENARALAELSAQALAGDLDPTRIPVGISLRPAAARAAATPEEARLIKESLKTLRSLTGGERPAAGAAPPAETALLGDIGEAFRRGSSDPAFATAFLNRLQMRRTGSPAQPGVPISPSDRPADAPAAFDCASFLKEMEDGMDGDGPRQPLLGSRLAVTQAQMEKVRRSMDELGRLRQGDLQALKAAEREFRAYEHAWTGPLTPRPCSSWTRPSRSSRPGGSP